jgi:cell division protein FtsB
MFEEAKRLAEKEIAWLKAENETLIRECQKLNNENRYLREAHIVEVTFVNGNVLVKNVQ